MMDDLMDALHRYVVATIEYEKSYLNEWGPGSATIKEYESAVKDIEKSLDKYVEGKIKEREIRRYAGCL